LWADLGISNFLEGDLFSWYLGEWSLLTSRPDAPDRGHLEHEFCC